MSEFTQEEQNFIKDLLQAIGRDETLNEQLARAVGMEVMQFDGLADSIFRKCENGRVTFDCGADGKTLI